MLHVAQVYDLVSGSRFCAGGSMEDIGHHLASLFCNFVVRLLSFVQAAGLSIVEVPAFYRVRSRGQVNPDSFFSWDAPA